MIIVSFDLGIRNFAVCKLQVDMSPPTLTAYAASVSKSAEILHWTNVCFSTAKSHTVQQVIDKTIAYCRDNWAMLSSTDGVVIEQQVVANIKMKCAMHALQALFAFHNIPVIIMPARQKFSEVACALPLQLSGKERSKELKKLSVAACTQWALYFKGTIHPSSEQAMALALNGGVAKADDLADSLIQAISGVPILYKAINKRGTKRAAILIN
jgi:hypothetical protein